MLQNCLRSISQMEIPQGWQVSVLVIDNSSLAQADSIMHSMNETFLARLKYVHEPRPGIPFARNRALHECEVGDQDWIAFIDDDECVDRKWLAHMVEALTATQADVFHGQTESKPDPAFPLFWPQKNKKRHRRPLATLQTAGTDNVMLRQNLVSAKGLGLRFDENMQFSGGSDREFFYRASDLGARIVWVPEAKAFEFTPPSRHTFWYQVNRAQSVAANECYISRKRRGLARTAISNGAKAAVRLVGGILMLPTGLLILLSERNAPRIAFLKASKDIASAIGTARGLFKKPPQRYTTIHGN